MAKLPRIWRGRGAFRFAKPSSELATAGAPAALGSHPASLSSVGSESLRFTQCPAQRTPKTAEIPGPQIIAAGAAMSWVPGRSAWFRRREPRPLILAAQRISLYAEYQLIRLRAEIYGKRTQPTLNSPTAHVPVITPSSLMLAGWAPDTCLTPLKGQNGGPPYFEVHYTQSSSAVGGPTRLSCISRKPAACLSCGNGIDTNFRPARAQR